MSAKKSARIESLSPLRLCGEPLRPRPLKSCSTRTEKYTFRKIQQSKCVQNIPEIQTTILGVPQLLCGAGIPACPRELPARIDRWTLCSQPSPPLPPHDASRAFMPFMLKTRFPLASWRLGGEPSDVPCVQNSALFTNSNRVNVCKTFPKFTPRFFAFHTPESPALPPCSGKV
jgi:hypothetical protein